MVILGLGSNLGNRLDYLSQAIRLLTTGQKPILYDYTLSKIYKSKAQTLADAPESWQDAYYFNMAILGKTNLEPMALLYKVKEIERKIGRVERERWAPREIDVDILLYKNKIINEMELEIPHKMLTERDFVLKPLVDLIPDHKYHKKTTNFNKTYRELYNSCKKDGTLLRMDSNVSLEA